MKKVVGIVLCALGLTACGRATEAWSMPEADGDPGAPPRGPGTSAPGSFDPEREVPSTRGTGEEHLIVPNDPGSPVEL